MLLVRLFRYSPCANITFITYSACSQARDTKFGAGNLSLFGISLSIAGAHNESTQFSRLNNDY